MRVAARPARPVLVSAGCVVVATGDGYAFYTCNGNGENAFQVNGYPSFEAACG